jgi:hypothetical protein
MILLKQPGDFFPFDVDGFNFFHLRVGIGQQIFLERERKKRDYSGNNNKNLQDPEQTDAVRLERHDFMMPDKKPHGDKGAQQHAERTDLIENHREVTDVILHNQGKRNLVAQHVVKPLKQINQDIQGCKRCNAEQKYF